MRCVFILFLLSVIVSKTFSQSAEDSVKATVNNLFIAMRMADAVTLKSVFHDNAIMQTITRNKQGESIVANESVEDFAASISKLKRDSADERIVFETIKIDGPLAVVWTPYNFYYNGRFSHCGVNSFHLVRLNSGWKIQYLIDTRRRTGCTP
jgi:hypothetical protein